MPRALTKGSTLLPNWAIAIFALLLLTPLVELPRPALITTPPWKVEFLVSLLLLVSLAFTSKLSSALSGERFPTFIGLLCLFIAWSGISIIWAGSPGSVVHQTFAWAVYLAFFLLSNAILRNGRTIEPVYFFAGTLAAILAVLCITDFATVVDFAASEGTLRIRWAKYAELLVTTLPFVWAIGWYLRGRNRVIVLAIGMGGWIAAMLSLSKAAFIAGFVGFAILFASVAIFSRNRHRLTAIKFAAIWILLTVGFQLGSAFLTSIPASAQYISGSADSTRSTSTMRVFTWSVTGTMIKNAPLAGVGADNFGAAFNDGRKRYAAANPGDPNNAIGEDYLFERAHNEYLQIAAELGLTGLLLFAAAFVALGLCILRVVWRDRGRVSPALLGASAGMCAFAVSSLFTSFSFRAFQNGIAFFAMASLTVYLTSKRRPEPAGSKPTRALFPAATFACLGLLLFSAVVGASQILSTLGERATEPADTKRLLDNALRVYPENGGTQLSLASVEAQDGNYRKAGELVRASIANGVGASIAYARLAEYEEKAGGTNAAIRSLEDGLAIFPRSAYLHANLAHLLERSGDVSRAAKVMDHARELDIKQANGWYALIRLGSKDAYQLSKRDPDVAGPAELYPQNGVYQYLNEAFGP